ncbi:iron-sulfur cluster assembly accessory protein [Buchnera aphidicola]|uniref:iron-sulfur cluster assembly accessory protein n=1 Tax=Buchnera aphidicola TaxID=9 RepID=UPI0020932360|nr:iron-sulfur cluster assembly accessory protein [Buchnera aphidicola]USS94217.1 iron-sulfur cluster assembly accessory protein [Buchnera aphidicola (Sipha maydis)]WII23765.1 iron-sulfur cluster assembly accessory protein [Buchnera aphidicola (Sipha maydis)]
MKKYFLQTKSKNLKGIFLTKKAYIKISEILKKNKKILGIMIDIKKSGCAGFKYILKKYTKKTDKEILYSNYEISIFLPVSKIHLLDGIIIDFIIKKFQQNFSFYHESSKNKCGCGISFQIQK